MPDQSNGYQLPSWPPTKIDRALWNGVMANLDARLKAREALEATFEILQEQGVQAALDYIQVSVAPQLSALQQSIANAQSAIDLILGGNAPNAQKLGGQLPSYYAKAQATAESLGALAGDISLLNTEVNKKFAKVGGRLTGTIAAPHYIVDNGDGQDAVFRWSQNEIQRFSAALTADSKYLLIGRHLDNGNWAASAIVIERSTGVVELIEKCIASKGADLRKTVSLPSYNGGVDQTVLKEGTGDGASYTTHNFILKGWFGMGMAANDGTISGYYDFRAGIWDVKGAFKVDGKPLGVKVGAKLTPTGTAGVLYTGLPANIYRFTVHLQGITFSAAAQPVIRLGTSGGIVQSGYAGQASGIEGNQGYASTPLSNGVSLANDPSAQGLVMASVTFTRVPGTNIWSFRGQDALTNGSRGMYVEGTVTLAGELDRFQLTTVAGTANVGGSNIWAEWEFAA